MCPNSPESLPKPFGNLFDFEFNIIEVELTVEAFKNIQDIQIPPFSYTVQHYVIKVSPDKRDALIDYLKDKNIHTSVHYRPLHLFTQFRDESIFPVADKEWLKMITLPVHLNMTDDDIDYVIYWVKEFFLNDKN